MDTLIKLESWRLTMVRLGYLMHHETGFNTPSCASVSQWPANPNRSKYNGYTERHKQAR